MKVLLSILMMLSVSCAHKPKMKSIKAVQVDFIQYGDLVCVKAPKAMEIKEGLESAGVVFEEIKEEVSK